MIELPADEKWEPIGPTAKECIAILQSCAAAMNAIPEWTDDEDSLSYKTQVELLRCISSAAVRLSTFCAVMRIAREEVPESEIQSP